VVVGLNTDESVAKVKGPTRPLVCYEDREIVVSAIRGVSWVLPLADETPQEMIQLLRPEVLVKGDEYTEDQIVGADLVRSWGGDVVRVPMKAGKSTSALLERLKNV
jgi:D-beta-D-heptose 7-phosphate kinase/D-beta-D-heptose 1-phosphate adenosyltransferase